jgi:hypothetical protein
MTTTFPVPETKSTLQPSEGAVRQPVLGSRCSSVAIDFESYYDTDCSVTTMGAWHYARATDIYMVSMYFEDGDAYVGSPFKAPWDECDGLNWIMHNAAFDLTLLDALIESGTVPPVKPRFVFDTADLAAYLGYPRSLKEAASELLGIQMSKATRTNMKGMIWTKDS